MSSSMVLNRIFKLEEAELKGMFSKIIEDKMKTVADELKKIAETKISEDLERFYSGSFDMSHLFDTTIDTRIISQYDRRYNDILSQSELKSSKVFAYDFKYKNSDYSCCISNKFILRISRSTNGTVSFLKPILHNIPLNVLYGFKLLKNLESGRQIHSSIRYQPVPGYTYYNEYDDSFNNFSISESDYKFLFNNCAEFETICKQDEQERKGMMEALKQEREEFESEKERFHSVMTDYTAFQEEKRKFEEEKKKLSLVKLAIEREKDKIKKEREEFEKEKHELELLKSAEINLDTYFDENK